MPDKHLRQPDFTYSASRPLAKNKEYKNLRKHEIQDIFIKTNYPANICWSPRRLWRRLQDMKTWRRLQHVLSVTIFCLSRRLYDVLKTSHKTSWRDLGRREMVTMKTSWRHVFKTSVRRFGNKENVYWGYRYLTNLNLYLTSLYFINMYLTNLWRI